MRRFVLLKSFRLRIPTQNDSDSEMKPAGIPKFPAAIPISNRPLF
jgi:hypothetical protein